jgi:hypothetical protein
MPTSGTTWPTSTLTTLPSPGSRSATFASDSFVTLTRSTPTSSAAATASGATATKKGPLVEADGEATSGAPRLSLSLLPAHAKAREVAHPNRANLTAVRAPLRMPPRTVGITLEQPRHAQQSICRHPCTEDQIRHVPDTHRTDTPNDGSATDPTRTERHLRVHRVARVPVPRASAGEGRARDRLAARTCPCEPRSGEPHQRAGSRRSAATGTTRG